MKDYLYLRVTQKEPFDILYFTPAITTIMNLNDRSLSLSPELLYTGFTNWEFRLKGTALVGPKANRIRRQTERLQDRIKSEILFFSLNESPHAPLTST